MKKLLLSAVVMSFAVALQAADGCCAAKATTQTSAVKDGASCSASQATASCPFAKEYTKVSTEGTSCCAQKQMTSTKEFTKVSTPKQCCSDSGKEFTKVSTTGGVSDKTCTKTSASTMKTGDCPMAGTGCCANKTMAKKQLTASPKDLASK